MIEKFIQFLKLGYLYHGVQVCSSEMDRNGGQTFLLFILHIHLGHAKTLLFDIISILVMTNGFTIVEGIKKT